MFGKIATGLGLIAVGSAVEGHADFVTAALPYRGAINAAASKYGVNPHILAALFWEETKFKPNAVGEAGEQGIGQMMPATFDNDLKNHFPEFKSFDNQKLFDANIAIPATAAWLSFLARNDNAFKALRDYNAGETGATRNPQAGAGYESDIIVNAGIDWLWQQLNIGGTA